VEREPLVAGAALYAGEGAKRLLVGVDGQPSVTVRCAVPCGP
jgi:hypothetical protein